MAEPGRNKDITGPAFSDPRPITSSDPNKMSTHALSFTLRIYAEHMIRNNRTKAAVLIAAANRLDDLEERIAIMTEPATATDEQISFPPSDTELSNEEGDAK